MNNLILAALLTFFPTHHFSLNGIFDDTPKTAPYTIMGNTVYITTAIGEPTEYDGLVQKLDHCTGTLHFIITSPGGDTDTMYEIADAMTHSGCYIDTTVRGVAASAAAIISISSDHLTVTPGGMLMFHTVQVNTGGSISQTMGRLVPIEAAYHGWLESHAKPFLTEEEINQIIKGKEIWLDQGLVEGRKLQDHHKVNLIKLPFVNP